VSLQTNRVGAHFSSLIFFSGQWGVSPLPLATLPNRMQIAKHSQTNISIWKSFSHQQIGQARISFGGSWSADPTVSSWL